MTSLNITIPTPLQPEKNPNRRFSTWARHEVYTGPNGTGAYVPNQHDLVWDRLTGYYEVSSVDMTTGLSILTPINVCNMGLGATEEDSLLSIGPGAASQAFVLLVDTSVVPHVVKFDHRFFIPGSEAAYVKIFKTANISAGGNVISGTFNSVGQMTSENISLESFYNNTSLKRPKTGYLTEAVSAGDLLNVVVYDRDGSRGSIYRMVVSLTNSIRDLNAEFSYVTGIELISEFVSPTDANLLEIPQNMNIDATLIQGRVYHLGKPPTVLPIDGSKFILHGTKAYIATVPNQEGDLVLTYKLGSNENAYGTTTDGLISRPYRVKTVNADLRYTLKLFAVPEWVNNKWRLRWFLYNLDRTIMFDVTDKVAVASGAKAYDGNPSNKNVQNLQMAINWNQVAVGNGYHYHVQNLKVKNNAAGSEPLSKAGDASIRSYVTVSYTDELDHYGVELSAKVYPNPAQPTRSMLHIGNGYDDLSEWLDVIYYGLAPLHLDSAEYEAPKPTHVRLSCGDFYRVVDIEQAYFPIKDVNIPLSPSPQGKTLTLEFIQQNGLEELELAMGYLTIQHVPSL